MKTYSDLSSHQQDLAVDRAVEQLVKLLVEEGFDYQFYSVISQKHFLDSFKIKSKKAQVKKIMESDEIFEELIAAAEGMAEYAYYPNSEEFVIQGVV